MSFFFYRLFIIYLIIIKLIGAMYETFNLIFILNKDIYFPWFFGSLDQIQLQKQTFWIRSVCYPYTETIAMDFKQHFVSKNWIGPPQQYDVAIS